MKQQKELSQTEVKVADRRADFHVRFTVREKKSISFEEPLLLSLAYL